MAGILESPYGGRYEVIQKLARGGMAEVILDSGVLERASFGLVGISTGATQAGPVVKAILQAALGVG